MPPLDMRIELPTTEEESFTVFYEAQNRRVRSVLFHLVGEQALDDLTQEVFIKAWKGLKQFENRSAVSTWLYRVAVNTAMDHLRKGRWFQSAPLSTVAQMQTESAGSTNSQAMQQALSRLDKDQRTVLVLHYFEDLKQEQIAEVLEIPLGTVKSRIHHAKAKLKEVWKEMGLEYE